MGDARPDGDDRLGARRKTANDECELGSTGLEIDAQLARLAASPVEVPDWNADLGTLDGARRAAREQGHGQRESGDREHRA
jgi:hypothetical protein